MIFMNKWLILSLFLQKQGNVAGYNLKGSDPASSKNEDETNAVEEILQRKIDKVFGERMTQVGTYNNDIGLNWSKLTLDSMA